jgi:hypothetical protein
VNLKTKRILFSTSTTAKISFPVGTQLDVLALVAAEALKYATPLTSPLNSPLSSPQRPRATPAAPQAVIPESINSHMYPHSPRLQEKAVKAMLPPSPSQRVWLDRSARLQARQQPISNAAASSAPAKPAPIKLETSSGRRLRGTSGYGECEGCGRQCTFYRRFFCSRCYTTWRALNLESQGKGQSE